jgi:hypothetical protein
VVVVVTAIITIAIIITIMNEREILKNSVLKEGNWPVCKSELTSRNLKQFIGYIRKPNEL